MRKFIVGLLGATALLAGAAAANAQGTVKIGLILPYSGQFADTASQMDNAIKLYVKEHGDTVAGKKIEFIRKDTGGIAPDVAKRLAQELLTRDKVDILTVYIDKVEKTPAGLRNVEIDKVENVKDPVKARMAK